MGGVWLPYDVANGVMMVPEPTLLPLTAHCVGEMATKRYDSPINPPVVEPAAEMDTMLVPLAEKPAPLAVAIVAMNNAPTKNSDAIVFVITLSAFVVTLTDTRKSKNIPCTGVGNV